MANIQDYFKTYPKEKSLLKVGEMIFLTKNKHHAEAYAKDNGLKVEEVERPTEDKEPKVEEVERPTEDKEPKATKASGKKDNKSNTNSNEKDKDKEVQPSDSENSKEGK